MKTLLLAFYLFTGGTNHEVVFSNISSAAQLNIVFSNHSSGYRHTDSVLVILDKYDHSGAGIVKKIFYPDQNLAVNIEGIPPGKYYLTIQYLGIHHDFIEKTVHLAKQSHCVTKVRLQDCEEFSKENVVIPAEKHPAFK